MIWATVSSQSCFCWLYRASPSSTAKNISNLGRTQASWGQDKGLYHPQHTNGMSSCSHQFPLLPPTAQAYAEYIVGLSHSWATSGIENNAASKPALALPQEVAWYSLSWARNKPLPLLHRKILSLSSKTVYLANILEKTALLQMCRNIRNQWGFVSWQPHTNRSCW